MLRGSVTATTPPFQVATPGGLRAVREVRVWAPYVDGVLLDDLALVMDHHLPGEDEVLEYGYRRAI
ncbi:hypothetical protein ACFRI7_27160 [Streptomyces sp. NPDC056716]|uniref:hypothetical protein n=1 Tax=unclassified Streptomyces TaxID=2593676 RepID=UPI00369813B8